MSLTRYPEYKDSGVAWLGEVPQHWEVAPYKHFVDIHNGADHKKIEQADGFPVIGSGGPFAFASEFLYDGESVLLGRKGTIDKPLYIVGKFWTVDTMYWTKISPDAFGKFAYYVALTIPFTYYSTNTALPSMTKGALSAHAIARPPLDEQTAIATFLDRETAKIDELIAEQEKLIALLAEKRQATISHAVTKGLNPDAPMKDSGVAWLGEVPAHWSVIPLKRAIVLQRGHDLAADVREPGTVPVVSSGGVIGWNNKVQAKGPGVVTGRYGTIGQFVFVPEDYWPLNTTLYSVQMYENFAKFLWFMLQSLSALFVMNSVKSAVPGVDRNDVHPLPIALPPREEQAVISVFLETETARLDALTAVATRGIALLKERRSALISAAVTGKIDVRHLVETEAA
ncbi:restriction endonuclease subunit S [Thauera terpenica]|jgi:type I restriction enzyme S subunit